MSKRRVVVTGLGMLSPGRQHCRTSQALLNGQSGISSSTTLMQGVRNPFRRLRSRISTSRVRYQPQKVCKMDLFIQYEVRGVFRPWKIPGLIIVEERMAERVGAIGSGIAV